MVLVLQLDIPYYAAQIVSDASVGSIIHACGATADNDPRCSR